MLAILAMLTRQGRGALRVAPGGCALPLPSPPLPSPPRRGLLFARSGRESRFADRTGKLGLGQCRLDHRVPLGVEGHGAHRCPVPGLAAPAARVRLTCLLIDFVPGSQQRTILAGMALCRRDVADTAMAVVVAAPMDEAHGPRPGRMEIGEPLGWEFWPVFGGAEQRLGVRVVVADAQRLLAA